MTAPATQTLDLRRIGLAVFAALAIILAVDAVRSLIGLLLIQPAGIDFLPLWTAGRLAFRQSAQVYDFNYVTQMQEAIVHARPGSRPFVYPPTALLLFEPWSYMAFPLANLVWVGVTGALALIATALAAERRKLLAVGLLIIAPGCVIAAGVGQTTFLIMALATLGTFGLKRHPWLAGVALGLAAAMKPSLLILAPFCLIAAKQWRALAGAVLAGLVVGLVSIAAFGVDLWFDWLAALRPFQALVLGNPGLVRNMITPSAATLQLGLNPQTLLAVQIPMALAALVLGILTFRRTDDWRLRMIAMLGGGLIAAPYAMAYEGVLIAPAVAALAATSLGERRWPLGLVAYLLLGATAQSFFAPYALVALVIGAVVLAFREKSAA